MRLDRECPSCGSDSVVSRREALLVFRESTVTIECIRETGAAAVCTNCYSYETP